MHSLATRPDVLICLLMDKHILIVINVMKRRFQTLLYFYIGSSIHWEKLKDVNNGQQAFYDADFKTIKQQMLPKTNSILSPILIVIIAVLFPSSDKYFTS